MPERFVRRCDALINVYTIVTIKTDTPYRRNSKTKDNNDRYDFLNDHNIR
jgi:hypothetical protein